MMASDVYPFETGAGSVLAELALAASTSLHCHIIVEITSHLNQRWARSSLTTNGSTTDFTVTAISFADQLGGMSAASVTQSVSDVAGLLDTVLAADAAALLNESQKLCLLINMADSLLSDGRAEQSEQQAFGKALSQFGMTEDGFKHYFETLAIKNNRSVFN